MGDLRKNGAFDHQRVFSVIPLAIFLHLSFQEGESKAQTFKVASMKIHNGWNRKRLYTSLHDIAIIKLVGFATR